LLRAAVLGQLNKVSEAEPHIAHVKLLKPEFESNAKHLISLWVKENELVEHILEGLRKAGLDV
jgi:5,10-methylenetetrahydrofolate reductase